ncbi:MAG: integrase [Chitinophagia bacterium]|nr:integrase [Chitinophagia bacterium]
MEKQERHRTSVIKGTLTRITNYPKLRIYLNNSSPYWQAVYWDKGVTYRRSSKTTEKYRAIKFAKELYEQVIVLKYKNKKHLTTYNLKLVKKEEVDPNLTFSHITSQWLQRKSTRWSDTHIREVERQLRKNVIEIIGTKQINRIIKTDLVYVLQKIEERGAHCEARRILSNIRQIWHYAIVIGACKHDITIGLDIVLHTHTIKHQNAVTAEELPKLMQDISSYVSERELVTRYALQLLALTFVRKNELLLAQWNEFNFETKLWKIPAERMKKRVEHVVPLTTHMIGLLNVIKRLVPSEHYVFNDGNPQKIIRSHAPIEAIYKLGYKFKMSVHGFRSVASTILNEHGFNADVIERQLSHSDTNRIRRAYNRAEYMEERIQMMTWWSNYLNDIAPFEF